MSRALALINHLAEQDILLSNEAGQLIIDAPPGALTDADTQEIQNLLGELLEWIPENPRPLPWRKAIARWSERQRLQWGRRANQLQDQGLPWYQAEARAFAELKTRSNPRRRAGSHRVSAFHLVG